MSEPDTEQPKQPEAPPPKPRLNPKLGLQGMVVFVMELRLRARMRDGQDATETFTLLTPEDLEKLEDVADTLEWLRMDRVAQRSRGGRR